MTLQGLRQFLLRLSGKTTKAGQTVAGPLFASIPDPTANPVPYRSPEENPRENLRYIREIVSSCMHARSEALARGSFHLERTTTDGPGKRVESHKLAELLLRPNPVFEWLEMLELISQALDAAGNALLLIVRDERDQPRELWPLLQVDFWIERDRESLPSVYWFKAQTLAIPARDIIHIRRPDLRSAPYYGKSIIGDLLDSAKADQAIRLFQSRYFINDGVTPKYISFPIGAIMSQQSLEETRKKWNEQYAGPMNAGKIGILDNGAEIKTAGNGTKELDFAKSKHELRDHIRQSFKVPKVALGDTDGVSLANAEVSYQVFQRDVVDFTLLKVAAALTRSLAAPIDPRLRIVHDLKLVSFTNQLYGTEAGARV